MGWLRGVGGKGEGDVLREVGGEREVERVGWLRLVWSSEGTPLKRSKHSCPVDVMERWTGSAYLG